MTSYRPGAVGALMDEYERAAKELLDVLASTSEREFNEIVDTATDDEDCRSIATIMQHVVRAGHNYANYIRELYRQEVLALPTPPTTVEGAIQGLQAMLAYTEDTLKDHWEMNDNEIGQTFKVRWGVTYNIDQLLEHAVCHILRHRRQIVRFKETMANVTTA